VEAITAKWGDNGQNGGNKGQNGDDKGVSSISRHSVAAKLQSAPGADNPRYAADHRRTGYGPIFIGGAEPSLPEKFFDRARKSCYYNSQNYFAPLTLPSNYLYQKSRISGTLSR